MSRVRRSGAAVVVLLLVFSGGGVSSVLRGAEAGPPEKPAARPAATDSIFQPRDFPSLGKLAVAAGQGLTFNTGTAEAEPAVSGAVTGKGFVGASKGGQTQLAVFAFDDIQLAEGARVEVTGQRGLVLLSAGSIAIHTTVDLSGKPGKPTVKEGGARGGPGGEGGVCGKSFNSAPPPADGGDGGPGMKDSGQPGHGYGAGFNRRVKGGAAGGGGGYGGAGGDSSEGSAGMGGKVAPMPGGVAYGNAALSELYGGSGGAGGSNDRAFSSAGGGGGGGALELAALKSITIGPTGKLLATGGAGGLNRTCGGGGSGGAILLAAPAVQLLPGAVVNVAGGNGGNSPGAAAEIKSGASRRNTGSGGGGGGGRVAIFSAADLGAPGKGHEEPHAPQGVNISGGQLGEAAKAGAAGSFYDGEWPRLK